MEALSRVVTRPIEDSLEDCEKAWILHARNVSPEQRAAIVKAACRWSAKSYGWGKIGLHLLDAVFKTQFVSRAFARFTDRPVCSWHVSRSYASQGFRFGEPPAGSTPAEILEFARHNPDKFAVIPVLL
jgi:hypothetical protein